MAVKKKKTAKKKQAPTKTKKAPAKKTKKKASAKKATKKKATTRKKKAVPVRHVVFVVDRSKSMADIAPKVVSMLQGRLDTLRDVAAAEEGHVFVSFLTFHSKVDAPRFLAKPIALDRTLRPLTCIGMTALDDALGSTIEALSRLPGAGQRNVSFRVIVLTDGYENSSTIFKKRLPGMIRRALSTQRWSFAVFTPKGGVLRLQELGVPATHIGVWEPNAKGIDAVGRAIDAFVR